MVGVLAIMTSMMGLASAKMSQASLSSTSTNQIATKANSIANSDAELVRATAYNDLSAKTRQTVPDTGFQHEVTLGNESDYSKGIKQRTVTILVYKGNESTPRISLPVTRYSTEKEFSGVPIGTVIAWAGSKAPTNNGTWLECNGQSCAGYAELANVLGKSTVPDYRNRFLEGSATPGTILEAWLPNITASVSSGLYDGSRVAISSTMANSRQVGAIKYTQFKGWSEEGWSADCMYASQLEFNAAWSNPIYGKSATVQPPAVTVRWLIKAA